MNRSAVEGADAVDVDGVAHHEVEVPPLGSVPAPQLEAARLGRGTQGSEPQRGGESGGRRERCHRVRQDAGSGTESGEGLPVPDQVDLVGGVHERAGEVKARAGAVVVHRHVAHDTGDRPGAGPGDLAPLHAVEARERRARDSADLAERAADIEHFPVAVVEHSERRDALVVAVVVVEAERGAGTVDDARPGLAVPVREVGPRPREVEVGVADAPADPDLFPDTVVEQRDSGEGGDLVRHHGRPVAQARPLGAVPDGHAATGLAAQRLEAPDRCEHGPAGRGQHAELGDLVAVGEVEPSANVAPLRAVPARDPGADGVRGAAELARDVERIARTVVEPDDRPDLPARAHGGKGARPGRAGARVDRGGDGEGKEQRRGDSDEHDDLRGSGRWGDDAESGLPRGSDCGNRSGIFARRAPFLGRTPRSGPSEAGLGLSGTTLAAGLPGNAGHWTETLPVQAAAHGGRARSCYRSTVLSSTVLAPRMRASHVASPLTRTHGAPTIPLFP